MFNLIDQLNPNLRTKDEIDGKKRVREFFKMTSNEALNIIDAIAKITGTTKNIEVIKKTSDDIKEEKRVNEDRRPPFKFSMIGMGKGDKIFFRNDNKRIATVVDENHVKYENNIYSLTALAKKLGKFSGAIQGASYFTDSRGIALSDLRKEKEQ